MQLLINVLFFTPEGNYKQYLKKVNPGTGMAELQVRALICLHTCAVLIVCLCVLVRFIWKAICVTIPTAICLGICRGKTGGRIPRPINTYKWAGLVGVVILLELGHMPGHVPRHFTVPEP